MSWLHSATHSAADDDSTDGLQPAQGAWFHNAGPHGPVEVTLFITSAVSLVGCLVVIITYWKSTVMKRHPNVLVVYRSIFDLVFSVLVIAELAATGQQVYSACHWLSPIAQICLLGSELWFLCLTVDLFLAITNPFTSYKTNKKWFIGTVAAVSLLSAATLLPGDEAPPRMAKFDLKLAPASSHGVLNVTGGHTSHDGSNTTYGWYGQNPIYGICWVTYKSPREPNWPEWGLFFIPLLAMYLVGGVIIVFALGRLKRGLGKSYRDRMQVFKNTLGFIGSYGVYWVVAATLRISVFVISRKNDETGIITPLERHLYTAFAAIFGLKGMVNTLIWLWTWRSTRQHESARKRKWLVQHRQRVNRGLSTDGLAFTERGEADEAILEPHLNKVLREEILHYTVAAIRLCVEDHRRYGASRKHARRHALPAHKYKWEDIELSTPEALNVLDAGADPAGSGAAGTQGGAADAAERGTASAGLTDSLLYATRRKTVHPPIRIRDMAPHKFARIRKQYRISNSKYLDSLSKLVKAKFSEGASGAFFAYSHDNKYVIKTLQKSEAQLLLRKIGSYTEYMVDEEDTLVCKFFQCTELRLYRKSIYFVVMENVFHKAHVMHQGLLGSNEDPVTDRYDLKGSWVNRSGGMPQTGKKVYCRHCHTRYKFGHEDEQCGSIPNGQHSPSILLLDQDLTYKVLLPPEQAERLRDQLIQDSRRLATWGIMDYSLLMGVHRRQFDINDSRVSLGMLAQEKLRAQAAQNKKKRARAQDRAAPTAYEMPDVSAFQRGTSSYSLHGEEDSTVGRPRSVEPGGLSPVDPSALRVASATNGDAAGSSVAAAAQAARAAEAAAATGAGAGAGSGAGLGDEGGVQGIRRDVSHLNEPFYRQEEGGMYPSVIEGPGIYYFGIIDTLQEWNWKKRAERFLKTYFKCQSREGMSATDPSSYQERFERRVVKAVITSQQPQPRMAPEGGDTRYGGLPPQSDGGGGPITQPRQRPNSSYSLNGSSRAPGALTVDARASSRRFMATPRGRHGSSVSSASSASLNAVRAGTPSWPGGAPPTLVADGTPLDTVPSDVSLNPDEPHED